MRCSMQMCGKPIKAGDFYAVDYGGEAYCIACWSEIMETTWGNETTGAHSRLNGEQDNEEVVSG